MNESLHICSVFMRFKRKQSLVSFLPVAFLNCWWRIHSFFLSDDSSIHTLPHVYGEEALAGRCHGNDASFSPWRPGLRIWMLTSGVWGHQSPEQREASPLSLDAPPFAFLAICIFSLSRPSSPSQGGGVTDPPMLAERSVTAAHQNMCRQQCA